MKLSKMLWRSRRAMLACVLVFTLSPIIIFTMNQAKMVIEDLSSAQRFGHDKRFSFIEEIKQSGCIMPQLEPVNLKMKDDTKPIIICDSNEWVHCYVSQCGVAKHILKTKRDIVCMYRDIIHVNDLKFNFGEPTKVLGDGKYVLNRSDHVKVECSAVDTNNVHFHSSWSGNKAGFRPVLKKSVLQHHRHSYNAIILCFDSTSRNEFIRKMHNSYKYLTEKLNAVILNSYNIAGDGTAGAVFPILSGKSEDELLGYSKLFATQTEYIREHVETKQFIFNTLNKLGYRTAYFEDMPRTWNPYRQSRLFDQQPSDHYLKAVLMAGVNQEEKSKKQHCVGSKPQYDFMIDLADQFLQLEGNKFCFTLIMDITYENYTVLPTADSTLLSFLHSLEDRRILEDTLVIIMGDHGHRYSKIRNTYQGKLEELLPFMAILLPEKLKRERPTALTALQQNRDVLTTPFDIHATILDVLDLKSKRDTFKYPGSAITKALTVLEPIPKSRSCGAAGIMPHWCACTKWSNISRQDPLYGEVGKVLADYINSLTRSQPKCARRWLISTEWVAHHTASDYMTKLNYFDLKSPTSLELLKYSGKMIKSLDEFYQAKILMGPGIAEYEGTMIYNTANKFFMITLQDVSRVNSYGNEPKCISATHPYLNKYCFCKESMREKNVITL